MRRNQDMAFGVLARLIGFATWRSLVCLTAFALVGCVAQLPAIEEGAAGYPPNLKLPPESLGRSLSLSQIVTGIEGDQMRSVRFEIEIESESNRLVVACLSHFGETLFLLRQDGTKVAIETFTDGFYGINPSWMLFDLQVTYWPSERLGLALSKQRMRLENEPKSGVRRVYGRRGELMMEVRYIEGFLVPGDIVIDHFDPPYHLLINALESESAP